MSEILKFDTEKAIKEETAITIEKPEVFRLVSEDHPILRKVMPEFDFKNPHVNPNQFASTLVETCKLHHGYGLSANQCGFEYRVFVMGAGNDYVAFYNPKILNLSDEQEHMIEGCLSFPFLGLRITRPKEITVEYQDFNGETKTISLSGISARCFQHELDHMNGIVYTSKAKPVALQQGLKKRNKIMKNLRIR